MKDVKTDLQKEQKKTEKILDNLEETVTEKGRNWEKQAVKLLEEAKISLEKQIESLGKGFKRAIDFIFGFRGEKKKQWMRVDDELLKIKKEAEKVLGATTKEVTEGQTIEIVGPQGGG